jgi:Tol biopolymer transport system component
MRVIALALVALSLAVPARGQSFGRNKVHYRNLDFQILETPHFEIYYHDAERQAAIEAGRLAERWYDRLSRALDHSFEGRQPIVLYSSKAVFKQTNIVPGLLNDQIGGLTDHEKGRVVLPFSAALGETDHVLGHELVHAFQRDILRQHGRSMSALPLWFLEGMAEYLSVGHIDANTAMWLRDSVQQNQLPRIDELNDPKWFPYRYGQALWAHLADRFGEDVVAQSLKSPASGGAIGRIAEATGIDAVALSAAWHESVRARFVPPARPVDLASTGVLTSAHHTGRLDVGPALSPDGKSIVFFTDRDGYSLDVVVADAATGEIRRKLITTAGDTHFESLQFIDSIGAWDPQGRRFALAALSGGRPVLALLDVATGHIEDEVPFPDLDQVVNPTWSPDGEHIAFSAIRHGFSDLYVVDLRTKFVRPLTADAYADLQPSWSPDGRSIAFSTDRFSSSMQTLSFGNFRLGLIDVASGTMTELPGVADAKHIDPHWSGDGASLYFIADAQGISNIHRVSLADGTLFRVTDVSTGVSGVTALSPALGLASHTNRLAFSVYRNGKYEIRVMDAAPGTPLEESGRVAESGTTVPSFDLPDGSQFTTRRYTSRLELNRAVQPYFSTGGGGSGGFLRAGVTLSFGDMLGDHRARTSIQVGKRLADLVVHGAYVNLRSRWNWAVGGGHIPWSTGARSAPRTPAVDGAITREAVSFRQLHRQVSGHVIYPFSDAKRLEISAVVQSITFDRTTTSSVYSEKSGQLLGRTSSTIPAARPALLAESGAALVYDTAIFGPTSPILGQRYRFEIAPTFGDLAFTSVTADYRRYVMPVRPFTIATRVLHLGRYGGRADDPRLLPLVFTVRDIVRGYGDAGRTGASDGVLSATRLLVTNLEMRFPYDALWSRRVRSNAPIEGLVFYDAGQFWLPGARSEARSATLQSVGAGIRLTAAGLVFEVDGVSRVGQPQGGWTFAINFQPGF